MVYYFQPAKNGTKLRKVTINKNGQYENFPPGFFEEDVNEAFEQLKALS